MAGFHNQRAIGSEFTLATADGLLDEFGSADVGVDGDVGLRHRVPVGLWPSPPVRCAACFVGGQRRKKVGAIMPESTRLVQLASV